MANTLFNRLEYSFTPANANVIIDFSASTVAMMNTLSLLIPEWGYTDLRDSNVSAYTKNPVATVSNAILEIVTTIHTSTSNVPGLSTMMHTANTCMNAMNNFFQHTQRLSGIDEPTSETADLPHYDTATGIGKTLAFMVYQSDSYSNGATILGSFTSVLVEPELTELLSSITGYDTTVDNSISYNPLTFQMESNLSGGTQSAISGAMNTITSFVDTRRLHDVTFYNNSRTVLDEYNIIKRYTWIGETENFLLQNYLGTEKLLTRLNE